MVNAGESLKTTAINASELYKGAHKTNRQEKIAEVDNILEKLDVLPHDQSSAKLFGQLCNDPNIRSSSPGDMDLLISSITLTSNEGLLTRNVKHFNMVPDLTVETW